ncbi:hypothetical protein ALC53_06294 [Atta colombica]|uniref:Uncharacterized protein n=1 Tax=Atta colombica TaxID=520822 RepID=A0A195BFP4_9HYME|nr:hypothetical protein ALC53_06294 [Atta colombica]
MSAEITAAKVVTAKIVAATKSTDITAAETTLVVMTLNDYGIRLFDDYGYLDRVGHWFRHFDRNLDWYLDRIGYLDGHLYGYLDREGHWLLHWIGYVLRDLHWFVEVFAEQSANYYFNGLKRASLEKCIDLKRNYVGK